MRAPLVLSLLLLLANLTALAKDFEFVVIGDTRPRFESESFRPFESLIKLINAQKPSLVVNLGDLIYGYGLSSKERQWDKYQRVIKEIEAPYYQVPGNHDTHSKAARRIYLRRFGKFYQSFDYGDCHFLLLDNTEAQRWGYLSAGQLEWIRNDLSRTQARSVFVFLHFPVWEPERVTPEYYEFWSETLHPLFKASRVKAVFAGHYHAYGPTREFDGIRYFISGGGGAELRPEYRKSGGEYHFMKIKVSGDTFDVRVVTERGEMTDSEADIMGGLQFAAKNVSRIGLAREAEDFKSGVSFNVSVKNPYHDTMIGEANWVLDSSAFLVQPQSIPLQIPPGATHQYSFTLKTLQETSILQSFPRLQFRVASGGHRHQFHREVRFIEKLSTPYHAVGPSLDGNLADWKSLPRLNLGGALQPQAELSTCFDAHNLYVALTIPVSDSDEAKELGFSDEVQIGLSRKLSESDFGNDFLRLGFNSESHQARDRTPGRKAEASIPGVKIECRKEGLRRTYESLIPLRFLKHVKPVSGTHLVLDVSFPVPENDPESNEPPSPAVNSFSYRIRYGSDSLVPVYFIDLNLKGQR